MPFSDAGSAGLLVGGSGAGEGFVKVGGGGGCLDTGGLDAFGAAGDCCGVC